MKYHENYPDLRVHQNHLYADRGHRLVYPVKLRDINDMLDENRAARRRRRNLRLLAIALVLALALSLGFLLGLFIPALLS